MKFKRSTLALVIASLVISPVMSFADKNPDRIMTTNVSNREQKQTSNSLPELKVKDVIENWDSILSKNGKDKIVSILGDMPLYDGEKNMGLEVYKVKTTDGDFLVYDPDLNVDFFSLKTNNDKYKVYNVLLSSGELLSADQDLSYGHRGAFARTKALDGERVTKIFIGTSDPKDGTLVFNANIALGEQGKIYSVVDWAYEMDKFALSGYVARRDRMKDDKFKLKDVRKPSNTRRNNTVEERDFNDARKDESSRRSSRDDRDRDRDRGRDSRDERGRRVDGRYDRNDRYRTDSEDQKRIKELENKIDELMKRLDNAGKIADKSGGTVIIAGTTSQGQSVQDAIKNSGVQLTSEQISALDKKYSELIDEAYYRYKDKDKLRYELENIMIQLLKELNLAKAKNIYIETVPKN